jgi:hypothetical protein
MMSQLSEKYFWSDFWMKKIHLSFVDMLLTWWDNSFIQVLWRSFPNDKWLSKKFWKIIYIAKDRNNKTSQRSLEMLWKLWINDLNETAFKFIRLAEVKYHEFWHSLFLEDKPNSTILEELKATLFYYLNLYNQKEDINVDLFWFNELIWFIVSEYIRRIPQKNNASSYQYWLLDSFIYNKAVKNNLIKIENNEFIINSNNKAWLDNFLWELKDALYEIQRIYKIKNKEIREKKEKEFIWNIFEENKTHEEFYKTMFDL